MSRMTPSKSAQYRMRNTDIPRIPSKRTVRYSQMIGVRCGPKTGFRPYVSVIVKSNSWVQFINFLDKSLH